MRGRGIGLDPSGGRAAQHGVRTRWVGLERQRKGVKRERHVRASRSGDHARAVVAQFERSGSWSLSHTTRGKTAKVVKDAIVGERKPKFGCGKKQKEMECEKIHVFMQCILGSGVAVEPIRALLSPSQTIEDARKAYVGARGRPMQQSHVRDENGYVLERSLDLQPLAQFSNDCQLCLSFSYAEDLSVTSMKKSADAWAWLKGKSKCENLPKQRVR